MRVEVKPRILLVAENAAGGGFPERILSDTYSIITACAADEALQLLENGDGEISLVLLDLCGAEQPGWAVLEAMNRSGQQEEIPVLAAVSDSSDEQIDRAYDLGAAECIVLPCRERVLKRRVESVLTLQAIRGRRFGVYDRSAPEERERLKYHFFASMSQEIQFEYDVRSDVLKLSEWGVRSLGIPERITQPRTSALLNRVFQGDDFGTFRDLLRNTTPAEPVVSGSYCLNVQGKRRWFKVVARTLWDETDQASYSAVIGKFIDIHDAQMELASLKHLAERDSLTALYNHKAARERICAKLASSEPDRNFALLLFDVDWFKHANDQHGHIFGDGVLQCVAEKMRKNIRESDIAARVGGDEFLIFVEYKQHVDALVQRIFRALIGDYEGFPITVSMGVALSSENGREYEKLFHCADQALYSAKKNGRNQCCMYNESIQGFLSVLSPMDH